MGAGPWDDLFDLCAEWLAACQDAVAMTEGGKISRAFVSPGPPAWDCCPQLTVHGGYALADTLPLIPPLGPGMKSQIQGGVVLIPLVCTVIRCVPTIEDFPNSSDGIVSAQLLEAAAINLHADLWSIFNHTWDQHAKGLLFAGLGCQRELFFDPAVPLTSAGGCAGWQIQIRVSLPGYKLAS